MERASGELDNGEQLEADAVILATGGKSYPKDWFDRRRVWHRESSGSYDYTVCNRSSANECYGVHCRALSLRNVALSVLNGRRIRWI